MTNPTTVNDEANGQGDASRPSPATPAALPVFDGCLPQTSENAIRLASCRQFEKIVVNTRRSVYELVILDGRTGDILLRGGCDFPEFCRALFVGSTAGGRALMVNTIDIGLRMEFHVGQGAVITSPVTAVLRTDQSGHELSVT
jgi:hypothetical protein